MNLLVNAQQALAGIDGRAPRAACETGVRAAPRRPRAAGLAARRRQRAGRAGGGLRSRLFEPFFTTKAEGVGHRPRAGGLALAGARPRRRPRRSSRSARRAARASGSACRSAASPAPRRVPRRALPESGRVAAGARCSWSTTRPSSPTLMRDMLEGAGYEVATAESGAVALELLDTARFDAIVSDLRMPDMDGAGAVARGVGAPSAARAAHAVRHRRHAVARCARVPPQGALRRRSTSRSRRPTCWPRWRRCWPETTAAGAVGTASARDVDIPGVRASRWPPLRAKPQPLLIPMRRAPRARARRRSRRGRSGRRRRSRARTRAGTRPWRRPPRNIASSTSMFQSISVRIARSCAGALRAVTSAVRMRMPCAGSCCSRCSASSSGLNGPAASGGVGLLALVRLERVEAVALVARARPRRRTAPRRRRRRCAPRPGARSRRAPSAGRRARPARRRSSAERTSASLADRNRLRVQRPQVAPRRLAAREHAALDRQAVVPAPSGTRACPRPGRCATGSRPRPAARAGVERQQLAAPARTRRRAWPARSSRSSCSCM